MIFTPTPLSGAFVIEPERITDQRGFFARTFEGREFETHGLNPRVAQCSLSFNRLSRKQSSSAARAAPSMT
jgi:dTDP-4-dehydrorhamnose 3,5-epimerase